MPGATSGSTSRPGSVPPKSSGRCCGRRRCRRPQTPRRRRRSHPSSSASGASFLRRTDPPTSRPPGARAADALLRQDAATAAEAEEALRRLLLELDVREIHGFAAAAVRESRKLESTAPAEAKRRAEFAHALAPSLPLTHLQLLRVQLAADPMAVGTLVDMAAHTIDEILFSDPRTGRLVVLDLAVALAAALLVAGGIALLFLAAGHARNVLHAFHHLFPRGVSRLQTGLLLGMLVLLPLALGLGPLASGGRRARRAVAPCRSRRARRAGRLAGRVHAFARRGGPARAVPRLGRDACRVAVRGGERRRLPHRARDVDQAHEPGAHPATLYVAARSVKRLGDLDEAEALYLRALDLRPRWPEAMVNLGNVRFLRGDLEGAEALYARAIDLDPALAPAYFDLSRVHYDRANITLGQAARARAVELDPSLVERYALGEKDAAAANQYVIDVPLPESDLDDAAIRGDEGDRIARQLGEALVGAAAHARHGRFGRRVRRASRRGSRAAGAARAKSPELLALRQAGVRRVRSRVHRRLALRPVPQRLRRRAAVDTGARERKERAARAYHTRRSAWLHAGALAFAAPFLSGRRCARGALVLVAGWFLALLAFVPGGVVLPTYGGWPLEWKLLPIGCCSCRLRALGARRRQAGRLADGAQGHAQGLRHRRHPPADRPAGEDRHPAPRSERGGGPRLLRRRQRRPAPSTQAGKKKDLIGTMLVRAELITEQQLEHALETQRRTLKRLGDVLVSGPRSTREKFAQMVQLQTTETLYRLFTWKSGTYEFEQARSSPTGAIAPIRARVRADGGLPHGRRVAAREEEDHQLRA